MSEYSQFSVLKHPDGNKGLIFMKLPDGGKNKYFTIQHQINILFKSTSEGGILIKSSLIRTGKQYGHLCDLVIKMCNYQIMKAV